ncbi:MULTISPECIES: glycosyltransferase [unclassified Bradyrhizobium]|uniref:glycosyltransferase family 2 protein n=1 Tax=unclassified Bradyrhizobium TaxID=2631580 RepID=UPI002478FBBC|nr:MULTISPECIES: glycosyltransferase [unclassified Bradyrhizobium]WGS17354.1 glycosyltransferase [Bradyrhizobium sp. ISRA463]WGS31090.1 glycosyltransferase [Bradyrhizobium sp. ISRA464]
MMLSTLNILLGLAATALALVTLSFALQAAAMIFLHDRPFLLLPRRPSVAILVPAHDEEQNIEATLLRIRQDLAPGDRLLVVADNCSDRTAPLAARAGAEILVRSNPERRGKGFALAAGLRHLTATPPEVVVFIDADCQINRHGIDLLARACATADSPIQCLDLMVAHPDSPGAPRLAEFAWRIKNDFRPNGYARLGLPCQLRGTGMAVPWAQINPDLFATELLAEDIFLGLELAIQGHPARFFRGARVTSYFPDTQSGQVQQKHRWVQGHLGLIRSHLPRLIFQAWKKRDLRLLALAADLAVPPLGMLAIADMVLLAVSLLYLAAVGIRAPLACSAFELAVFAFPLVSAWYVSGRDLIGFREVAQVPRHMIMVMRTALALARGDRTQWVRADRPRTTPQFIRHMRHTRH